MACDNSKTPYAVPRRSLPTITNPNGTLGSGLGTVAITKLSHWPRKRLTSNFPARMSAAMTGLWSSVPINTTGP